ncbi:MAG: hypothetical protein C4589_11130 [Peptococcaceae bacterium]|nr:MAG: hypothetical protein C4589_11130 [Peptococcaceae bacterium]
MLENAISKIRTEMNQNANNPYIQVVGGFLLQHLETCPVSAEKIMATDKTIAKSLDEMRKVANKNKVGNCAVLTDAEGFAVVLKYFGIEEARVSIPTPVPALPPVAPVPDFDVKLEDLL